MKGLGVCLLVAVTLCAAPPCLAVAVENTVDSHTVTTFTGADALARTLDSVRAVEIGSSAVTLTVDTGGGAHRVPVSYGRLASGEERGGVASIAMLSLLVAGFTKLLGVLMRLGRG